MLPVILILFPNNTLTLSPHGHSVFLPNYILILISVKVLVTLVSFTSTCLFLPILFMSILNKMVQRLIFEKLPCNDLLPTQQLPFQLHAV